MKDSVLWIAMIGFSVLFFSCATSADVAENGWLQKRKYTKGYHIDKNRTGFSFKKKQEVVENDIAGVVSAEPELKMLSGSSSAPVLAQATEATATPEFELNLAVQPTQASVSTGTKEVLKQPRLRAETSHHLALKNTQVIKSTDQSKLKAKKRKTTTSTSSLGKIILYLLAFILPWLAVGIASDWKLRKVLLNLLLMLLGYIPAVIHAIIVVKNHA